MFRRKKKAEGPDLSREEMEELVDENMRVGEKQARAGNVAGMEMSLEIALEYAQKMGRSFDSREIGKIKLMGYERGEKVMQERSAALQNEGKMREAQNAARLASAYGSEATLLRNTLG
jgi:hypothetical protein